MDYSAKVLEHFRNPRNVGEMKDPDGVGRVGSPKCGDTMELYIKVKGGKISDVRFKTLGCGAAIASSSMLTEMMKGKTVKKALEISNRAVVKALDGLPRAKVHCSVMAEQAMKAAIEDYIKKNEMSKAGGAK